MKRRRWFDDDAEIRRRHADRMMYRPVNREPFPRSAPPQAGTYTIRQGDVVSEPIPYDGYPDSGTEVDRSVHMRPAETQHPPAEVRRRDRAREWAGEAGAAAGELLGELIGWLVRRLLD